MLGRRSAGAGLEQAATGHERHDGQHLRAGTEFHDRKQVSQVITQHIAGDRDRVLAATDAFEREAHRVLRLQDADVEAGKVVILQTALDPRDDLRIVAARGIQPEHRRGPRAARTRDREADPIHDRRILRLAHAPDVTRLDRMLEHHGAVRVADAHDAIGGNRECLVVRTVFLGLLRHQADIRHAAHGRRVECAVRLAIVDDRLVDAGVTAVRDQRVGVLALAGRVPHLAGVADHRRHRRVDDDVARHVQVGDAFRGIDHRERRSLLVLRPDVGLDRGAFVVGQGRDACVQIADAVVRIEAERIELGRMPLEHVPVERAHRDPEQNRIGHLHHRCLEVQREQHAILARAFDLGFDEGGERLAAHHRGVDDLANLDRDRFPQQRGRAVARDQFDPQAAGRIQRRGLLAGVEVARIHVRDAGLRIRAPCTHAVRMLARIVLDRRGCTAVRIALAQHRVDRAALDPVVARTDVARGRVGWLVRIIGQRMALLLQLGDRGLELRHRRADVRQLDDVRVRRGREAAEFGEVVGDLVPAADAIRELREDACGERDVARLHRDAGARGERLDDRQQRTGREVGCLVGQGVQDARR